MAKRTTKNGNTKKKRGRPYTGEDNRDPIVMLRMPKELTAEVADWAKDQPGMPSRSEALRRLVKQGLESMKKRGRKD